MHPLAISIGNASSDLPPPEPRLEFAPGQEAPENEKTRTEM